MKQPSSPPAPAPHSQPAALTFRPLRRDEVDLLVDWAAREGWNPGLHDAELFWATDPDAFVGAELDGALIGGGAITAYGDAFGFMGFFIVQPAYRGKGLGDALWHVRRERLLGRLRPGATIGMDGVFNMQPYYVAGGFVFSHRNLRFRYAPPAPDAAPDAVPQAAAPAVGGPADPAAAGARLVALAEVPFDALCAYDRCCFPAERARFLAGWIAQPDGLALGCLRGDTLVGYGVLRRCRDGCKIGPLFADDAHVAAMLFDALAAFGGHGPVFLDVPENNLDAMALVRARGMTEVFGCARMYLGPVPAIRHERVFGVTTFELG